MSYPPPPNPNYGNLPPPPVQNQYAPPPQQGYAPPPQQGYAPPPQQNAPPTNYAPPLHSMQQPMKSKAPPVYTPSVIPNDKAINYNLPHHICCMRNDHYLTVNEFVPNCPLSSWSLTSTDNQKWWFTRDGYIESAQDRTYVIDCVNIGVGSQLVLAKKKLSQSNNAMDPAIVSQKWNVISGAHGVYICNVTNQNLVMELAGSTPSFDKGDLIRINSNLSVNNTHQGWRLKQTSNSGTAQSRIAPFETPAYIFSAETGLYLTVKTGKFSKTKAGAPVVWSKGKYLGGAKAQQWVMDKEGFIASNLDSNGNLVLDCKSSQCGEELIVNQKQYTNNLSQKWTIQQYKGKAKSGVNLKPTRTITSNLNTNLLIDERGKDQPAFINFPKNTNDGQQKVKFKTA